MADEKRFFAWDRKRSPAELVQDVQLVTCRVLKAKSPQLIAELLADSLALPEAGLGSDSLLPPLVSKCAVPMAMPPPLAPVRWLPLPLSL
jgi:hypothetical protein